jgi:hypothetical protein
LRRAQFHQSAFTGSAGTPWSFARMPNHLRPVELIDPAGHLVVAMINTRDDALAGLFADGTITSTHWAAIVGFRTDVEVVSGAARAPAYGPADLAWRGRRPTPDRSDQQRQRLQHVAAVLGQANASWVYSIAIDHRPIKDTELPRLLLALDDLTVAYNFSTAKRH